MANNNSCYILNMRNKYGPNWIITQSPENIQKNTRKIVKEIAKGSIDYEKVSEDFMDPKFLENLIIGINNELTINGLNYTACVHYYNTVNQDILYSTHINHLERVIFIYRTILDRLNYVKLYNNIGYMADINGILFNDRKHLDLI